MNRNIRHFAAVVSLTVVLGSTPVIAAPNRDRDPGRDRTSAVQVLKRLIRRLVGVTPTADMTPPTPAPSTPNP